MCVRAQVQIMNQVCNNMYGVWLTLVCSNYMLCVQCVNVTNQRCSVMVCVGQESNQYIHYTVVYK